LTGNGTQVFNPSVLQSDECIDDRYGLPNKSNRKVDAGDYRRIRKKRIQHLEKEESKGVVVSDVNRRATWTPTGATSRCI
jgi:hypothetical protein